MNILKAIAGLFEHADPVKIYLTELLKTEVGAVSPPVGTEKQIGSVVLRAFREKWTVKLVAVREE